MKGGRENRKVMGPLFPRLHVNDADKGGPRAPPRNKMALYEQLSITSKRFNHGAVLSSPGFHASSSRDVVSSASENTRFLKHNLPSRPLVSLPEEIEPGSSNGKGIDVSKLDSVKSPSKSMKVSSSKDPVHGKSRASFSSSRQKNDDEGDFSVPTIDTDQLPVEKASLDKSTNMAVAAASSYARHQAKALGSSVTDLKFKRHEQDNENASRETFEMENFTSNKEHAIMEANGREKSEVQRKMLSREVDGIRNLDASNCSLKFIAEDSDNHDALGMTNGSRMITSEVHILQNCRTTLDDCRDAVEVPQQIEEKENNDYESGSSKVDFEEGVVISPDDVYNAIGPKNYWKTRQALRTQQRVFAEQVFNLHKLIKVQKSFATSPSMLLEGNPCLSMPCKTYDKKPSSNSKPMPLCKQQTIPSKEDEQKSMINHKSLATSGSAPEVCLGRKDVDQAPKSGQCTGDSSTITTPAEINPSMPWCFPLPGNQWLIPVMSPSEGLVYKPCAAPYPPNFGFMGPSFNGCRPVPMYQFPGGAFPIPMPMQQQNIGIPANYFMLPHGIPIANQGPSSTVDHVKTFMNALRKDQVEMQSPISENYSNPESDALSGNNQRTHVLRENELNGSTASSSSEKGKDIALRSHASPPQPLPQAVAEKPFPTSLHGQVIKVVPRNGRTATESAARIFQSIQRERQRERDGR